MSHEHQTHDARSAAAPATFTEKRRLAIKPLNPTEHGTPQSIGGSPNPDAFSLYNEDGNYQNGMKQGHNSAKIEISPRGTRYYRKLVLHSDGTSAVNFQAEELFLQKVQELLRPPYTDPLKYRAVGRDMFEIEMCPNSCNLKDFLTNLNKGEIQPPAEPGFISGLATALVIKVLLGDADNRETNIVIYPNRETTLPGQYCADAIDAEQIGHSVLTFSRLVSPTIESIVDMLRTSDGNKKLISTMVDPKEFEYLFKLIFLYKEDLEALAREYHKTGHLSDGQFGLIASNINDAARFGELLTEGKRPGPLQHNDQDQDTATKTWQARTNALTPRARTGL